MATRAVLHDPNLNVDTQIVRDGLVFYRIDSAPFTVHGLLFEDGKYRRLPETVAEAANPGVQVRARNSAGGRVRFTTNSARIAILAKMENCCLFPHCAFTGTGGFDLYDGVTYIGTFTPPVDMADGYESSLDLGSARSRDITIHFPTYSDVTELYIGLEETAALSPAPDYSVALPVVYYGSSITQGGCASRPGITYQGYISRRFDCDYLNLGFSGSAKGEDCIAQYISRLPMSVFVYDYDYNAPTVEHLAATHEKFFLTVRAAHPDIPIVMMSRPKYRLTAVEQERREIVMTTFNNAVARGDRNVYFLDGPALMAIAKNEGTVDNCHPNDLGFFSMAKALGDLMEENGFFKM